MRSVARIVALAFVTLACASADACPIRVQQAAPTAQPPVKLTSAALRVLATRPIAVRGAPLLLPIRSNGVLPTRVEVVFQVSNAKPMISSAAVLWPVRVTRVLHGRWATSANPITFETVQPVGATDAFLAIDCQPETVSDPQVPHAPPEWESLTVASQTVRPAWMDAAPRDVLRAIAARASMVAPTAAAQPLLARPEFDLPLERFRFSIGVALRGWEEPPAFEAGSANDIAARATTALWHAALARISSRSTALAAEVAELLIATCGIETDEAHENRTVQDLSSRDAPSSPIAAWIADPAEISTLLGLILEPSRTVDQLPDAVASWLRVRSPLLAWIDDETRDEVVIAMANPSSGEQLVRMNWVGSNDPPLAALLEPSSLQFVRVARPHAATIDGAPIPRDAADMLRVEHNGAVRILPALPIAIDAGVEGRTLLNFVQPIDLAAVSSAGKSQSVAASPVPRTMASLRPRLDGWEIFVEARDLIAGANDSVEIAGPNGAVVRVSSAGAVDDPTGALAGSAGVAFAAYPDQYRLGFVVPPTWIDRRDGRLVVPIGFRRSVGDARFDAPFAAAPWRAIPRTIPIDIRVR
ncbi:MAG: hypothetical protein QM516_01955 [Limnohabitans sp.]|nr:hypothetical protein [Limnohabitans sp.]